MLPTATLFCLCEKVITADDNTVSIITIMERLTIEAVSTNVPTVAPISWSIFTFWTREDDSIIEHFEQKVEGFSKETTTPFHAWVAPVNFDKGFAIAKIRVMNYGMPVSGAGRMRFTLSVRAVGDLEWHKCSTVPVDILVNVPSPP